MKKTTIVSLLAVTFVLSISCASMPGTPGNLRTTTSEFDGSKEIIMEPAWICPEKAVIGCSFRLGLFWRSTMPKDTIYMIAEVQGIESFGSGESLHFNVDGEIISFKSIDQLTDFETTEGAHISGTDFYVPPTSWSANRYVINKAFLEKILKGQRVAARLDLRKTYLEGLFSRDAATLARPAFRNFYTQVFGSNQ